MILILFLFLPTLIQSQDFCPVLNCTENLGTRTCYKHSQTSPVTFLKVWKCPDATKLCDILSDMAWVNTDDQYWSSQTSASSKTKENSNLYRKNTVGYCKDALSLQKDLNAGRSCLYNH